MRYVPFSFMDKSTPTPDGFCTTQINFLRKSDNTLFNLTPNGLGWYNFSNNSFNSGVAPDGDSYMSFSNGTQRIYKRFVIVGGTFLSFKWQMNFGPSYGDASRLVGSIYYPVSGIENDTFITQYPAICPS